MAHNQRPRLGLFVAGGAYAYQTGIIQGAHDECVRRGFDLVCLAGGSLSWSDPRNHSYFVAAPAHLDAAILAPGTWGADLGSDAVRQLLEPYLGIPSCTIGAQVGDLPSVRVDNEGGVAEVTRHLIDVHGRRRIAFLGGPGQESEERRRGYERALAERDLPLSSELSLLGDFTFDSGVAAARRWCAGGALACDAVVTANDWMASGVLEHLQQVGVRVPDDVAVVGFDDIDRARFMVPPLTTIRQPPHYLGSEAVCLIAERLAGAETRRHVVVPTLPQLRRSCGCYGQLSSVRSPAVRGAAGGQSLEQQHARIAALLVTDAGALAQGLPERWAEALIDALLGELRGQPGRSFVAELLALVSRAIELGNLSGWSRVVARLREQALPCLQDDVNLATRAESLFGKAYIAIGERAELAQAQRYIEREELVNRLELCSREARSALDWRALCRVLTEHLPRFHIPSFYVSTSKAGEPGVSRQVYAFVNGEERELPPQGIEYATPEIVAPSARPAERSTLVVNALFMREEILGHCAVELGPRDFNILKTLGSVISSSLKASQLADALVAEVTRRERAERERMLQELEIAARIQTAILPKQPRVPGLEIATELRSASEVGGDYFDILPCEDGAWIGIGDVAGHGLPAGVVMLMIQSIVASAVRARPGLSPADGWQVLNDVLTTNVTERLQQHEHATFTLLRYRPDGRMRFAGAHEDLLVYRHASASVERVPTPGIWLGITRDLQPEDVEEQSLTLGRGDVLLLYTDGVIQARNAAGEQFGLARLSELLATLGERPVRAIAEGVVEAALDWTAAQDDDLTLVVLRHVGG